LKRQFLRSIHSRKAISVCHPHDTVFTVDLPTPVGGLDNAHVMSAIPRGILKSFDFEKLFKIPGVVDVVTYRNIQGISFFEGIWKDQPVFTVPSDEVRFIGHIIAMVLAETEAAAYKAAKLANIEHEPLKPVLSIAQAIAEKSFNDIKYEIKKVTRSTSLQDTRTLSKMNSKRMDSRTSILERTQRSLRIL
jgi:xanthine dehydrogenase molybdopterin-binding subunit B